MTLSILHLIFIAIYEVGTTIISFWQKRKLRQGCCGFYNILNAGSLGFRIFPFNHWAILPQSQQPLSMDDVPALSHVLYMNYLI